MVISGAKRWVFCQCNDGRLSRRSRSRPLKVSTDELLGVKPVAEKTSPKTARLLKRLRRVEELPPADQRAVLKLVDAMLETRRRTTPARTNKKKAS